MNAWSHLPNAHHIDWVIKTLKENPKLWYAALDETQESAYNAAYNTTWDMSRLAVQDAAQHAARDAAWDAAQHAAFASYTDPWDAAMVVSRIAAGCRGVTLALTTYNDCDRYLQMTHEQLKVYAVLSEKPQAVLLLPMKYVEEKLNECLVTPA